MDYDPAEGAGDFRCQRQQEKQAGQQLTPLFSTDTLTSLADIAAAAADTTLTSTQITEVILSDNAASAVDAAIDAAEA